MTQQSHYWAYTLRKPQFKKTHGTPMFIAALFTIARTWKQHGRWMDIEYVAQGNSLAVQWLGFHASTVGGMGLIPAWGTKIPHSPWCGQEKKRR